VTPADLLTDLTPARDLMAAAPAVVASLNERGSAEALALAAGAGAGGRWRVSAIDPEGIDLNTADRSARLWFAEPVASRDAFHAALASLLPPPAASGTAAPS